MMLEGKLPIDMTVVQNNNPGGPIVTQKIVYRDRDISNK